jgi:CRP-like cAMP-binding protein
MKRVERTAVDPAPANWRRSMTSEQTSDSPRLDSAIRSYAKNEAIAREGETSVGWFVLLDGRVGVFKHGLKIAEFEQRGMVLGELSGILEKPRTASLVALEPTRVAFIDSGLDQLIADHPDVTRKILPSDGQAMIPWGSLWNDCGIRKSVET